MSSAIENTARAAVAFVSPFLTVYDAAVNTAASVASCGLSLLGGPSALPKHIPRKEANPVAVFVTGASAGIGHEVVFSLLRKGYLVFAGVRRVEDGLMLEKQWSDEMESNPAMRAAQLTVAGDEDEDEKDMTPTWDCARVVPIVVDVTKEKQINAAVGAVQRHLKQLNATFVGLVNVAGSLTLAPMAFAHHKLLAEQFDVNYFGVMDMTQAFFPLLKEYQGRVVNIGSMASFGVTPGSGPYSSSKAALAAATEALRMELRPFGIGVSLIEPGAIRTRAWDRGTEALQQLADGKAAPNTVGVDTTRAHLAGKEVVKKETNDRSSNALVSGVAEYASMFQNLSVGYKVGRILSFPPKHVGQQVEHALTSAYPRPRYLVGIDAKLLATVMTFAPTPFTEYFLKMAVWG
ncbi:hypothetical protein HK097_004054 [Rhizophlyctis rosea]|uniref:Uncharacterized protein n=1 Tax=Rhizophlyctis rosea TaxID=64517 RepID=A0AAD5X9X0_9FUNG|nr:hypothetical protein HK097_004054 [Rhizophlyctis rosea]